MRCKWPQLNVADMKTRCIVAAEDASARGDVHSLPSSARPRWGLSVGRRQEPIYGSPLDIDNLLRHSGGKTKKKSQSPAVISALLNNNTYEVHKAASTYKDKSGKWPPPTNTGKVWIKRFAWTQWRVLPSARLFRPSIRATQNTPPFVSQGAFNRAFRSYDL